MGNFADINGGKDSLLGTLKDRQERLWRRAYLSIGTPLGNLEGVSSTRNSERWLKGALEVERLSLYGSSVKGTWRDGSLAEDHVGQVGKALELGISFHKAPLGNLEGAHLPGTFRVG